MAAIAFTAAPWGDDDVARLLAASRPDRRLCIDILERSVGECRQAADAVLGALHRQGADVAFAVTEDPKYEWLGTMCRYQPSKGMHEVDYAFLNDPEAMANRDSEGLSHTPGWSREVLSFLVEQRAVAAVGHLAAVLTDTTLTALIRRHADPATVLDRITATLGLDWRTPTVS